MAAAYPASANGGDPAFISYLLSPDMCDWFFLVGDKHLVEPERIGVVKKMVLAHSVVLRSDMIDYKQDVSVKDTYPDTFKNLLRFVYGHDNTAVLSFEEADNLLYLAEKYLVEPLKARLSVRLMDLLSPDNVCILLNNPACYRALELYSTVTQILQYETDQVLGSPHFLDLSVDGLVKVVEQQALSVSEIDLWRAAVRWARHRASSESKDALRRELERPARHLRVCTIDKDTLCDDVFTAGILTGEEMKMVCLSKSKGERQTDLVTFSNDVERRRKPLVVSDKLITFDKHVAQSSGNMCVLCVLIGKHPVEVLPLKFVGLPQSYGFGEGSTYECQGSITVAHTPVYRTSIEPPVGVRFCRQVGYGKEFTIPLALAGKNVVLQPDSRYLLFMTFSDEVTVYYSREDNCYTDEHVRVWAWGSCSNYLVPLKVLRYRPLL